MPKATKRTKKTERSIEYGQEMHALYRETKAVRERSLINNQCRYVNEDTGKRCKRLTGTNMLHCDKCRERLLESAFDWGSVAGISMPHR